MSGYLRAGDTISGQEAVAKMTVKNSDGTSNIEDMFFAKNLEATCTFNKTAVRTLGKRGEQHKPNSWTGSGSMTIYYATSIFRKMAAEYIKKGKPVYFDIVVSNTDPASTIGTQTVVLKNCTLDSTIIAKFDVDADVLDESMNFTFDDADVLETFVDPELGN